MQGTSIDNSTAAERLIAAHDGDVALLYIFYRHTGSLDLEAAARALCRTMQDLKAAEEKLRRMELLEAEAAPPPAPVPPAAADTVAEGAPRFLPPADDELPQYTSQDITRMAANSPGFQGVCTEAARVKGKQLSSNELGILAGIYDYLALPPEVIFLLLNYCLEKSRLRHPGSRPGFRMIQQEAFRWANLELLTLEQAEEYIARQRDRSSAVGQVQALLGLGERPLTAPERKNIDLWLDMGFDSGAIQLAYERTVYNTGALKWSYMGKILQRWHESGLHDRKTIEEKDTRRVQQAPQQPSKAAPAAPIDLDKLQELLENI